jgi:putative PIN family toxin of toxin-antitoxin system
MTSEPPLRVVLDPNVLISAAITPSGSLGRIVALIDAGALVPLATQHLVDEVAEVLARPKLRRYIEPATAEAFCAELGRLAEWHAEPVDPPAVCRDPDDDYLLALAIASHADALVTGDDDLHAIPNAAVEIITPRELLDLLGD